MAFMEILKFPARSTFPATGDNNRLYIDLHSKRIYYWDHGAYQIASPDIVEQGSNPISEAFSYAGIVATVADLPTEGIRIGDVYIVEQDEGHEQNSAYVWSGTQWIEIGGDMEHLVAISWANLKALRDAGELVPGAHYRITDYTCTTTQENTQSAGHVFDIIVTADGVNKLNENARACLHEGDTYFANSKLEAWKLKYCLDNDTDRFAWADEENGKGVIYRMIDEFNNDVPYDFKNIQYQIRADENYDVYTFSKTKTTEEDFDVSLNGLLYSCYNNTIRPYVVTQTQVLNRIIFVGWYGDGLHCYSNTFGANCHANTFAGGCHSNTFGNDCEYLKISDNTSTPKKYIHVENGTKGASDDNQFDLYDSAILDKNYQVTFKKSASGKYLMLWATDTGTMTGKVKDDNIDTTWEDIIPVIDGGTW